MKPHLACPELQETPRSDLRAARSAKLTHWVRGSVCCDSRWEAYYNAFESPEAERVKFRGRLRRLGARQWTKDGAIVELFCGRGNGLRALESMGFSRLSGVDLSPSLLEQYEGPAQRYVGDCRDLKFENGSQSVVIVQGGLHHLPDLERDLPRVLAEAHRVLEPGGRLAVVEPWKTPFLRAVHSACGSRGLRRLWPRLDALAGMIEEERETYEAWLACPDLVDMLLETWFQREFRRTRWGKLYWVGRKREAKARPAPAVAGHG